MTAITIVQGDCVVVLGGLADCSVDAIVTDPPYGLGFMGKEWDKPGHASRHSKSDEQFAANPYSASRAEFGGASYGTRHADAMREWQQWCSEWAVEALRVLKPGGHLLAFGGTRTWHRLAVAVEDAGFEIRDSIAWLYGSGFPKSMDVSKAIDKAARGVPMGGADPTSPNHGRFRTIKTEGKRWEGDSGQSYGAGGSQFLIPGGMASGSVTEPVVSGAVADASDAAQQWQGWGTALKPAHEPVVVARKPLAGTVASNVIAHGTGALNIDACRIGDGGQLAWVKPRGLGYHGGTDNGSTAAVENTQGRWPTNVILDETQATALDQQTAPPTDNNQPALFDVPMPEPDPGTSRFFYVAKAPGRERPTIDDEPSHPTVKPLTLMRHLVRLITPPGGTVLDPFLGSGTTAEACVLEGFNCIGIEREPAYVALSTARLSRVTDPTRIDVRTEGAA